MDIKPTTSSTSCDQLAQAINKWQEAQERRCTRITESLRKISELIQSDINLRDVREQACHYGNDCYCYQSKEGQLKPKDANAIKMKIFEDIKSGIEILTENTKEGYEVKYDAKDLEQFKRALKLLHSTTIDISKLDIINPYNDKQCKYVEGTNQSGYTVIYNNIELFTIINTDSKTRFPESKTTGLDFDLEFHAGFDEIYSTINVVTNDKLLTAKDRVEADINSGIKIYEDKIHNSSYGYTNNQHFAKINSFNKILRLLEDNSIDLNKLQTIDFFGDYASSTSGYTVVYNDIKLFTVNNIDEGKFETKYIRIKDFEVKFDDGFEELYNSLSSIILTDAINIKNSIEEDLINGIETIKEAMETDIANTNCHNEQIANINKILQLLNSSAISIVKLQKTEFTGIHSEEIIDCDYTDHNEYTVKSGYTVVYDGNELFKLDDIEETCLEGTQYYFEIEFFDYFNELYSSVSLS